MRPSLHALPSLHGPCKQQPRAHLISSCAPYPINIHFLDACSGSGIICLSVRTAIHPHWLGLCIQWIHQLYNCAHCVSVPERSDHIHTHESALSSRCSGWGNAAFQFSVQGVWLSWCLQVAGVCTALSPALPRGLGCRRPCRPVTPDCRLPLITCGESIGLPGQLHSLDLACSSPGSTAAPQGVICLMCSICMQIVLISPPACRRCRHVWPCMLGLCAWVSSPPRCHLLEEHRSRSGPVSCYSTPSHWLWHAGGGQWGLPGWPHRFTTTQQSS